MGVQPGNGLHDTGREGGIPACLRLGGVGTVDRGGGRQGHPERDPLRLEAQGAAPEVGARDQDREDGHGRATCEPGYPAWGPQSAAADTRAFGEDQERHALAQALQGGAQGLAIGRAPPNRDRIVPADEPPQEAVKQLFLRQEGRSPRIRQPISVGSV